ncbi:MAG: hypothetical protein AB7O88_10265 [Reyranellaceae bacterium]
MIDGQRVGHPDVLPALPNGNLVYPRRQDWAFLKLDGVSWCSIEGLRVINCWPCFLYAQEVRGIAIRRCTIEGGTYPLFFRDPVQPARLSTDLVVEACSWRQDLSADHFNWSKADWRELHGGREGSVVFKTLRHLNGAFVGSCDIGGSMRLRGNDISDAYNGFRLGLSADLRGRGEAEIRRRNRDIEISGNVFTRVRDNPIEPESHAYNWIVRHNTMLDCHTWFSMDAVAGGYWYIYGNLGWFRSRQGGPKSTMGKVMKFSMGAEPVPDKPIYFFNNSWFLRCPIAAGDPHPDEYHIENLVFLNNAIQYCKPRTPAVAEQVPPLCQAGTTYLANIRWIAELGTIDHTICDHPDFPATLRQHGHEVNGVLATRPLFTYAEAGDLTLAGDSEARGGAAALSLARPGRASILVQPVDHGAWQGTALIAVPELEAAPFPSV